MVAKSFKYRVGGVAKSSRTKYRYGGSGILTNILGRTVLQNNVKNLINSVTKSKLGQKAVGAVVDGGVDALKHKTSRVINHHLNKKRTLKSAIESLPPLDKIIAGKGIVYD